MTVSPTLGGSAVPATAVDLCRMLDEVDGLEVLH